MKSRAQTKLLAMATSYADQEWAEAGEWFRASFQTPKFRQLRRLLKRRAAEQLRDADPQVLQAVCDLAHVALVEVMRRDLEVPL